MNTEPLVMENSMKKIVLFGAGKSATCLIDYLKEQCSRLKWHLTVVDADPILARAKVGRTDFASVETFDINNKEIREKWVSSSDLVISLLPASLHTLVAEDCLHFGKHLLTASYISPEVQKMEKQIQKAGVLFMGEMGLDPGIDHMSVMKILDSIRNKGGEILSFEGYCGALMAPENDDSSWHYKFSWNPMGVILAGQAGAMYRKDGKRIEVAYPQLFENNKTVEVPRLGNLAYYPNRDSLHYASLYHLENVPTILRATLRYPSFCRGWHALIKLGLTDNKKRRKTDQLSFSEWALQKVPAQKRRSDEDRLIDFLQIKKHSKLMAQLKSIDLLSQEKIAMGNTTNAEVLQHILTEKLKMEPNDKDMIVMLHKVLFKRKSITASLNSYLIVLGEDNLRTAIAKTVGLPLGILAKLILMKKIQLTGLHIPVMPEVYLPVLHELEDYGIRFEEYFG